MAGWMAPRFSATMPPSGRRLRLFCSDRKATCWRSAAEPGSTLPRSRQAPDLTWWPSDIYPSHLASIEAWRRHAGLANLRAPQRIDLTDPDWSWHGGWADGRRTRSAMLCINVLHISPWRVAQNLIAGAGRLLRADGRLFIYGPFMRDGQHTAPSNADFDASLRAENPAWGVRDLADLNALAQEAGLTPAEIVPMPANNLVLAFARAVRQN